MKSEIKQTIQRRKDGSIDHEHFVSRGQVHRSKMFHKLIARISLKKPGHYVDIAQKYSTLQTKLTKRVDSLSVTGESI